MKTYRYVRVTEVDGNIWLGLISSKKPDIIKQDVLLMDGNCKIIKIDEITNESIEFLNKNKYMSELKDMIDSISKERISRCQSLSEEYYEEVCYSRKMNLLEMRKMINNYSDGDLTND